ncbi:MAG: hypothetical protein DRQ63_02080 [Gammaproteobacteria bacterium]|nr:MAG: hypothetical protein DRQ63_02080 [Gammaproteobacteria bacterium]
MNFQGNFTKIDDTDITSLKELVLQLTPEHWTGDTTRQRRYEAHRHTQAIGLVYDLDFRHENPTVQPPMQLFAPALRQVLETVANHYEALPAATTLLGQLGSGYFIRANLVRLNPGGEITAHQDKNFSLAHSHRVHIPIVTNDQVKFAVGSETINMRAGEIFEINNRRIHSVRNDGEAGRVHLILDWVTPDEPCCCSAKTHPGEPCSPQACVGTDRMKIPCVCFPEEQSADTADLN